MNGLFLSFEGGEALGKSIQAARLAETLRARGREVLLTREPGGTPFAERIRDVLLHAREVDLTAETQALLFSAARAQHTRDVIRPALAGGKIVVADRYFDSTLAYQGYGSGADIEGLRAMTRFAVGDLVPQRTFLIDAPVDVTLARLASRAGAARWDRFHGDDRGFYERVREGYLRLAAAEPGRFVVVDGDRSEEAIAADIRRQVDQLLGLPA
ncbi:MAG TPA: dTMP kinase [Candidatus Limnocylindria bacterium]|nr:dTMP kinase [Candidatus Limnocylindria bacterium]